MSDQPRQQQQSAATTEPSNLDAEKDRERLEPGLNTAGTGEAGADRARVGDDENSNT